MSITRINANTRIRFIPDIGITVITPGGAAAAWSPTDIAGCQLWLKADAGTYQDSGFTTPASIDTDPIGGWQDQSGNGNHATQTTNNAYRPLLKLNIKNGLPVLRWDGTNDGLNNATFAALTELTVFIVYHTTTASSKALWTQHNNALNVYGIWDQLRWYVRDVFNNPARSIDLNPAATTNWALAGATYNDATKIGELFLNSMSQGTDSVVGNLAITGSGYAIGNRLGASVTDADIAEIIIYNSVLSVADRILVETYLNSRYAIW